MHGILILSLLLGMSRTVWVLGCKVFCRDGNRTNVEMRCHPMGATYPLIYISVQHSEGKRCSFDEGSIFRCRPRRCSVQVVLCGVAAEKFYQLVEFPKQLLNTKRHANELDIRVCNWSAIIGLAISPWYLIWPYKALFNRSTQLLKKC